MTTTISPSWSGSLLVSYEFPPVARDKLFKITHKAKLFHFCSGSHHWSATVPFFLSSLILSSDLKHKHQPKTNAISHIKKTIFKIVTSHSFPVTNTFFCFPFKIKLFKCSFYTHDSQFVSSLELSPITLLSSLLHINCYLQCHQWPWDCQNQWKILNSLPNLSNVTTVPFFSTNSYL